VSIIRKWWQYHFRGYYEDGDNIVSKNYGTYPKVVPFIQGMTLYPGQKSYFLISEPRKSNE